AVGGLPIRPNNRLCYNEVFSIKGLINEYCGLVEILKDGHTLHIEACHHVDEVLERYESAVTKGGLSSTLQLMKNRGVLNCEYRTIRHKGHFEIINFLKNDCQCDEIQLEQLLSLA